ncbi:hypothetical protein GEMRC1_006527 [Eukaryota sp. GEM-RC1]
MEVEQEVVVDESVEHYDETADQDIHVSPQLDLDHVNVTNDCHHDVSNCTPDSLSKSIEVEMEPNDYQSELREINDDGVAHSILSPTKSPWRRSILDKFADVISPRKEKPSIVIEPIENLEVELPSTDNSAVHSMRSKGRNRPKQSKKKSKSKSKSKGKSKK